MGNEAAPARLESPASEVHVWQADLDLPDDRRWQALAGTLAPDERDRADRLHREHHRRRFVAGRGLLRTILGTYLGVEPGAVRLAYAATGKPRLAGGADGLAFNLAHADALWVVAIALDREVGVDVERLRPMADMAEVAACCFSARERNLLAGLGDARRIAAFYRAWTRKEAWLKATGWGLTLAPSRVEVTMAEEEPARLLGIEGGAERPGDWSLHDLHLGPGYIAALAVSGAACPCRCRAWPWRDGPSLGRFEEERHE